MIDTIIYRDYSCGSHNGSAFSKLSGCLVFPAAGDWGVNAIELWRNFISLIAPPILQCTAL